MAVNDKRNVAVLGASPKPERYSNKAVLFLQAHGFAVYPVNPARPVVCGLPCFAALSEIKDAVDTLTIYVRPEISAVLEKEILSLKPKRVIFNPGSENPPLKEALREGGIKIVEACTLVMLNTGQF
jgi:uncharacterized protein